MNVDKIYATKWGRLMMSLFLKSGLLKILEAFMRSRLSKPFIGRFIQKNQIDMSSFEGVSFDSFSSFFKREKAIEINVKENEIVSPADSMLSLLDIDNNSLFKVKNTPYHLKDFLKDEKLASQFEDGLCLIFRLQATDYHHYGSMDDGFISKGNYIEGTLHSVQPIVYEHYPVFKTNRRNVMTIDTKHLGLVGYISVGAVLVGGLIQTQSDCEIKKGQDIGYFDLIGSTVVILLNKKAKQNLVLKPDLQAICNKDKEVKVSYGDVIGEVIDHL